MHFVENDHYGMSPWFTACEHHLQKTGKIASYDNQSRLRSCLLHINATLTNSYNIDI